MAEIPLVPVTVLTGFLGHAPGTELGSRALTRLGWGFARSMQDYVACLGPPLMPTLPALVDRINASSVLELGCGERPRERPGERPGERSAIGPGSSNRSAPYAPPP